METTIQGLGFKYCKTSSIHQMSIVGLCNPFATMLWAAAPCGIRCAYTGLWLAGNEGMDKNMETAMTGYIGATIRIHSFILSS